MSSSSIQDSPDFANYLCTECRRIIQSLPEDAPLEKVSRHYDDFNDVLSSAKSGCYLCQSLALEWEREEDPRLLRGISEVIAYERRGGFRLRMHARLERSDSQNAKPNALLYTRTLATSIMISAVRSETAAARAQIIARTGSTNDETSMLVARSWLDKCLKTHKGCNDEATKTHWHPTRLLRLGKSRMGITIRLQEHGEENASGPYVALSHRWGGSNPMTLKSENLSSMKASIAFTDLSKTFQDAIHATMSIGCEYLWIDSLCIVQDSKEDWMIEASSMKKVYRNALLTISATNPRSLDEGLSSVRHSNHASFLIGNVRFQVGSQKTAICQVVDEDRWKNMIRNAPINRRGWVLQERLLSRRIFISLLFSLHGSVTNWRLANFTQQVSPPTVLRTWKEGHPE
ncbi:heterokaryon incompatibility protein-domain-containing protein [Lophiotrema nucula]|uniref:Heterokaryon incompatibility protein-domain-containing protein n=1 Tax=Lophiotrema nucula TaxID=690887 RepID=A0A6A5ZKB7_9PLEO|nr:heterokaryon incompatibility protein-domain-containing protein [Lophiotrema nucula]